MLIISLVLAVIGLAALVFAVITSNELVAWVCIGASVLGVVLLIIDALQERQRREAGPDHETVSVDSRGHMLRTRPPMTLTEGRRRRETSTRSDEAGRQRQRRSQQPPRINRRRQQLADLVVADLMEVGENLSYRVEVVGMVAHTTSSASSRQKCAHRPPRPAPPRRSTPGPRALSARTAASMLAPVAIPSSTTMTVLPRGSATGRSPR